MSGFAMKEIGRLIETDADVAEGAAWLGRIEPRFADVWAVTGPWPLRRRSGGFEALLQAIAGQQISTASASAFWARCVATGLTNPATLLAADDETLKHAGFSRQKARYARALAVAALDYGALETLPDDRVIALLTAQLGIGRWTADIYAAFALGRADIMPAGDLAVVEAARLLFDLPERPTETQMRALAGPWAPWRAVAARGLWAYYAHVKKREGAL
ncbi:DNA-3-methyladenine glycosylase [Oceaniovalibus sp. ACAM 378]|uniref:DNA-3-methyladenine glycosylase family protein n=1 Tax=Oceaniovalibus sp. ACAM 378 TaxID=2599923 RepID=UPI00351B2CE5